MDYSQLKRPGVYLEEIALLPPSVAGVSTAVPAFIGYTESAKKDGKDTHFIPTRISSMIQYQQYFGGAPDRNIVVSLGPLNAVDTISTSPTWYLYDSVQLFFANGGEICYIVSIGNYDSTPAELHFKSALDALKKYDEPTLIAMPDVMRLSAPASIGAVQQEAIKQCAELQNRFAILDVYVSDSNVPDLKAVDLTEFRDNVSGTLKYAAAYYPWLKTASPIQVSFATLTIMKGSNTSDLYQLLTDEKQVKQATKTQNYLEDWTKAKELLPDSIGYYSVTTVLGREEMIATEITDFLGVVGETYFPGVDTDSDISTDTDNVLGRFQDIETPTVHGAKLAAIIAAKDALIANTKSTIAECDKVFELFVEFVKSFIAEVKLRLDAEDKNAKDTIPLYAGMIKAAMDKGVVVPPCGAVAGVYATVDAARGVWKAPANVDIKGVAGPVVRITDEEHMGLNVSPDNGKSINAIRNYTGKGTMVMGARTLAGNDNEWRYVNVRRLFIMAETAIKKATEAFIFEPNTTTTWLKVKGMIESYLHGLWQSGALAGSKPEQAYFVNVGLGKTMSQDDILNGRMLVDVGLAAVRPAEFIVLRFSHKMQEA